MVSRLIANLREGRMQKLLAASTALSAPPLALEVYLEHYKGSFGDKWMWTPIVLTPPLTAAGIAGFFSERAARTWLPAVGALYALDGLIGIYTHFEGVRKKPVASARRRTTWSWGRRCSLRAHWRWSARSAWRRRLSSASGDDSSGAGPLSRLGHPRPAGALGR